MQLKTWDFYCSRQQIEMEKKNLFVHGIRTEAYFNGQRYTECIAHGKKPLSLHEDLQLIGTGTMDNILIKEVDKDGNKKERHAFTLEKVKEIYAHMDQAFRDNLDGIAECTYEIAIQRGSTPTGAAFLAMDAIGEAMFRE